MAREVAARRGEGLTETIHHALSEELRRLDLGAPKTDRIDEDLAALYALLDAGGPGNGRTLTGIEAEAQGLITEAVPADRLHARVLEIAEALLKKDPHALRATKWAMRRMVDMTYDNALDYQIRAQEALNFFGGAAARKEATRQFLDEKSFKPGLGTFDASKVKD